ncbi:aspartic peptidase domain-containing protein [Mycena amicta]|nr:aspartic peptidase domain-containing protein [Mycena amicta]
MLATVLCLIHLALAEPLHLPLTRGRLRETDVARRGPSDVLFDLQEPGDWYYTTIYIGTPPQQFQVALEMFTSRILVVAPSCVIGCPFSTAAYDPTQSFTSSEQSNSLISISLYSTIITGEEFTDVVDFGLYSQKNVQIVQVLSASTSWIISEISGTIGLGGNTSTNNALWLSLLDTQSGIQPEFSFWLARSTAPLADGGAFTFGGVNASLYSGEIEFLETLDQTSGIYWTLGVSALTVQGSSISITPSTNVARIDIYAAFGIGAPAPEVAAFWAKVPGASQTEFNPAYYEYPCSTQLNVSIAFGGKSWSISSADLNAGNSTTFPINGVDLCTGAFYAYDGTSGVNWAIGSSFLKNVYSVFRPTTGQIGFAELSTSAGGQGTSPGVAPAAISAPKSKSSKPIAAIAGGAAGGGVALILAMIAIFCLCRRRRRRNNKGKEDTTVATPEEEVKMEDRDADAMVLVPFVYEPSRDRVPQDVFMPTEKGTRLQPGGISHTEAMVGSSVSRWNEGIAEPEIATHSADAPSIATDPPSPVPAPAQTHTGSPSASETSTAFLDPNHQRPDSLESYSDSATSSADPAFIQELQVQNLRAQVDRLQDMSSMTRRFYPPPTDSFLLSRLLLAVSAVAAAARIARTTASNAMVTEKTSKLARAIELGAAPTVVRTSTTFPERFGETSLGFDPEPTSSFDDDFSPPPPVLSNGDIAGIAVGAVVILALLAWLLYRCCKRRKATGGAENATISAPTQDSKLLQTPSPAASPALVHSIPKSSNIAGYTPPVAYYNPAPAPVPSPPSNPPLQYATQNQYYAQRPSGTAASWTSSSSPDSSTGQGGYVPSPSFTSTSSTYTSSAQDTGKRYGDSTPGWQSMAAGYSPAMTTTEPDPRLLQELHNLRAEVGRLQREGQPEEGQTLGPPTYYTG